MEKVTPIIVMWTFFAIVGVATSTLTILLLQQRLRKEFIHGIQKMLIHDTFAEAMRGTAQVIACVVIVGYLVGFLGGDAMGWVLVAMNAIIVITSVNELITTWRNLNDS